MKRFLAWTLLVVVIGSLAALFVTFLIWHDYSQPVRYDEQPYRTLTIERVFANTGQGTSYTIYFWDGGLLRHETYNEEERGIVTELRMGNTSAYAEFYHGYREPWFWYKENLSNLRFTKVIIFVPKASDVNAGTYYYGKGNLSPRQAIR